MRVPLAVFGLVVMLFGTAIADGLFGPEPATASPKRPFQGHHDAHDGWPLHQRHLPRGRPFQILQEQIDALQAQIAVLAEEAPVALRVFDGEGNDLGLYAGRDTDLDPDGPIHVFLEDVGVTASYHPSGILGPIDRAAIRYESEDCSGPVFYDVAGVVGRFPDAPPQSRVAVTGTVTRVVLVGSAIINVPRGQARCEIFSPPIPTPMVPVEVFGPADIDVPIQVAPGLFVAPAES